ncbi:hypothetical protein EWM64_g2063 [Hericium alpestre]|uniref:Inner centromere protein ARK-binding domain-containing protein n=1 Tax=Hericium alpestre TaxID=135208 RepID=A0A4Z0A6H0_9AGAM|nr:hypothetical protein EWM64_g2063 [Hericium alpestre]
MADESTGVLSWVAGIRSAMVQDPARQMLDDKIQSRGFLFLDDYLDNILLGVKQESAIVELVKTPGRKKDVPKKTRSAVAAATRAQNVISLSLDTDDGGKENVGPMSDFHRTLLQAGRGDDDEGRVLSPQRQMTPSLDEALTKATHKQKSVKIAVGPEVPEHDEPEHDEPEHDEPFIEIMSSSPQHQASNLPDIVENDAVSQHGPPATLEPAHSNVNNDLSIIAEDEEPTERSRMSVQLPRSSPPPADFAEPIEEPARTTSPDEEAFLDEDMTSFKDVQMDFDDFTHATAITVSDSTHTFHSIPLASPSLPTVEDTESAPDGPGNEQHTVTEKEETIPPLPSAPTASTIFPSMTDMTIPIRDHDSSESGLTRKGSLSQFPALPAPSPLRKSMRGIREPSMGAGLAAPSAAAAAAGKRTSWLSKAREAKAMDKRASATVGSSSHQTLAGLSGGVKRKSGDMLTGLVPSSTLPSIGDEGERKAKLAKFSSENMDVFSAQQGKSFESLQSIKEPASKTDFMPMLSTAAFATKSADDVADMREELEDVLDRFKKPVGKSVTGKSFGGAAATALAEARAAAEARVAERNKAEGDTEKPTIRVSTSAPTLGSLPFAEKSASPLETDLKRVADPVSPANDNDRRMSVSDLVSNHGSKGKGKQADRTGFAVPASSTTSIQPKDADLADLSTSTTPPNSPPPASRPQSFAPLTGPVFNKPPPVFVPPPVAASTPAAPPSTSNKDQAKDYSFKLPTTNFPPRNPFTVGLQPQMPSSSGLSGSPRLASGLSAQSTQASLFSDTVFGSQDVPAWAPSTQDTSQEFSIKAPADSQINDLDDDDSWRLDDKFGATNQMWTPIGLASKEDSMTWSTLPSQSQRGDTAPLALNKLSEQQGRASGNGSLSDMEVDEPEDHPATEADLGEADMDEYETDLDDVLDAGKSTVSLVDKAGVNRNPSQLSLASSSGSSSQMGFFGQASKLVSSMLGGGKKVKAEPKVKGEPVKSIQLAAAVAKKHQEEQDRKTARLKEMEARRQAALQRKAEDEKTKADEYQKKIKEEAERRKKDREEHTGKRPLKPSEKKADEDNTKKRKLIVEMEQKQETKKPPSKEKKEPAPSRLTKPSPNLAKPASTAKPLSKQASSSALQTAQAGASSMTKTKAAGGEKKPLKSAMSKGKGKAPVRDDGDDMQPSKMIQADMAARVKAQVQASKHDAPVPSEMIELPEPNSEYSDSEDESRPGKFDAPEWAQSPELRSALESQATVNPDDIFGEIKPLRMEDMFRTRQSRFRARTSSANWSGPDGLTREEERDYARRMGFR